MPLQLERRDINNNNNNNPILSPWFKSYFLPVTAAESPPNDVGFAHTRINM